MKKLVISLVCLIILGGSVSIYIILDTKSNVEALKKQRSSDTLSLRDVSNKLKRTTVSKDSMSSILKFNEPYRHMSEIMAYRDSVTRKLDSNYGETVWLKPDSSVVTIVGVSISGGRWSHQVKYVVVNKEQKEFTIEPELILKKQ